MSIDWLTFFAQIVNFAILVWLLRVFLYDRIVKAMHVREVAINQKISDAAAARQEAERQVELLRVQNLELASRRESLLEEVARQAEARRTALLEEAHREAGAARSAWMESLRSESKVLAARLRENIGQQVFSVARKALGELSNSRLEKEIIEEFKKRVLGFGKGERESLADSIRASGSVVEIGTGFVLNPEERERLCHFFRGCLDDSVKVRFIHEPHLLSGIELRADSHRLIWSLASHLEGLEERVFEILDEGTLNDAQIS